MPLFSDCTSKKNPQHGSGSYQHSHSPRRHRDDGLLEGFLDTPIRHLAWDDNDHWKVLTQLYGSVWPRVLRFCIVNACITWIVFQLKHQHIFDVTFESSSHKYMGFLMSFLVVTRAKLLFDQYMAASRNLREAYRTTRNLTQQVTTFTMHDKSERAKQWRQDVCYAAILLLRSTVSVLRMRSDPESLEAWEVPELTREQDSCHSDSDDDDDDDSSFSRVENTTLIPDKLAHLHRKERIRLEEASRMPMFLAFHLKQEIMKVRDGTWVQPETWHHPCLEQFSLMDNVDAFMKAYAGLRDILIARFPFPLVQLAKTFLFLWVFSVSFTICYDNHKSPYTSMAMVFLITYGFFGIELVACELDDCFGDDPSDFDALGHARLCFEDCYISIYRVDGEEWAHKLRTRVKTKLFSEEVARRSYFQAYRWGAQTKAFMTPNASQASLEVMA